MIKHLASLSIALSVVACSSSSSVPSTPTTNPTPAPPPTPAPTPTPENLLPDTYCVPAPPPLSRIKVKVHLDVGYKKILDSRAFVGPDANYCTAIGFVGFTTCVVRDENDAQSVTCNNLALGKASDTGRYGPTWSWNGQACRSAGEGGNDPGCKNPRRTSSWSMRSVRGPTPPAGGQTASAPTSSSNDGPGMLGSW